MPFLPQDIHWHLIGQLQTNKINKTIGKFDLIHSIDGVDLAQALSKRLGENPQDILLEVNTSGESPNPGFRPVSGPGRDLKISVPCPNSFARPDDGGALDGGRRAAKVRV